MAEEEKTFRSKVDRWIVVVLALAFVIPLVWAGYEAFQRNQPSLFIYVVVCELISALVIMAVGAPISYKVGSKNLSVRAGVMRWEIPLQKITSVRRTRNPLSSPAWSLNRVRIDYDNDGYSAFILISPIPLEAFFEALRPHVPEDALSEIR